MLWQSLHTCCLHDFLGLPTFCLHVFGWLCAILAVTKLRYAVNQVTVCRQSSYALPSIKRHLDTRKVPLWVQKSATLSPEKCHFETRKVPLRRSQTYALTTSNLCIDFINPMHWYYQSAVFAQNYLDNCSSKQRVCKLRSSKTACFWPKTCRQNVGRV